ncbi:peptidyl-alpha-hydroxyglycine alpha-amidating lyase family protein [Sphingomonas floccifaciens]|uniref:Peptidyl-alpha-hydroxyglycine alpha-amidating lyase family protein n=1 Tax=Sphingomonas floccifaciens TaxID=1844115 RepID=A0ABW4N901_9SPHN
MRMTWGRIAPLAALGMALTAPLDAQDADQAATPVASAARAVPANLPRTYTQVADWATLPPGTGWQDMMAVDIDANGDIYALQRTPFAVLVLDAKGRFLRQWTTGNLPGSHGLRIDRFGYVWITSRALHQVFKYTRDGKLLMTLGTRGVAGDNASRTALNGPADVAVAPNGDIFVADGESANTRIVKFSKDGTFVKSWGTKGDGPGQLMTPHSITFDTQGRLLVGNRGNKRIEIFDRDGGYRGQIATGVTPYGLFVTRDGTLYVADGIKPVGSISVLDLRSGRMLAHVPGLTGSHALTVDRTGAVYVAEVSGKSLRKFVRAK